jgi:hypothetical protein
MVDTFINKKTGLVGDYNKTKEKCDFLNNCNERGTCVDGLCVCLNGSGLADCSKGVREIGGSNTKVTLKPRQWAYYSIKVKEDTIVYYIFREHENLNDFLH